MIDDPVIIHTEAQLTAVIHLTIPREDSITFMGPAIHEILDVLKEQGITPAGALFSHHLKMPTEIFDFEIGIPVNTPITAAKRVKPSTLPETRIASTTYHGGYEGLGDAWGEFKAWISTQELKEAPDLWESYVLGPETDPDPKTWRTVLNQPLVDEA
ncbi:GyrI-like domain-containing protein [Aquirhabdus parva]|uniref:AraC family transcriptional regulator n=1 Tax=Aquirhabdus parva TaxID=2283318 RepID=A0A345P8M9_9GAMM|nr:GyrI-like domain-containing protein [Aquirhabdus parva]AXI03638.1 AraC family transcriptional regulator [Aquirhabdus parva]